MQKEKEKKNWRSFSLPGVSDNFLAFSWAEWSVRNTVTQNKGGGGGKASFKQSKRRNYFRLLWEKHTTSLLLHLLKLWRKCLNCTTVITCTGKEPESQQEPNNLLNHSLATPRMISTAKTEMPGYRQDKHHYTYLAFFTYHTSKKRKKKERKRYFKERKEKTFQRKEKTFQRKKGNRGQNPKLFLKLLGKNKTKPQLKGTLKSEKHHTISHKIRNLKRLFILKLKRLTKKKKK